MKTVYQFLIRCKDYTDEYLDDGAICVVSELFNSKEECKKAAKNELDTWHRYCDDDLDLDYEIREYTI